MYRFDGVVLKKSIDLGPIETREPWISRRARYPETTEADTLNVNGQAFLFYY